MSIRIKVRDMSVAERHAERLVPNGQSNPDLWLILHGWHIDMVQALIQEGLSEH